MKITTSAAILLFASSLTYAQGAKSCNALKSEIQAKLDARNVQGSTLEIVAKDKDMEGKVVGTCEAGSKKIVYSRAAAPTKAPTPAAAKP